MVKDREAWRAAVHGVTKSQIRLSGCTTIRTMIREISRVPEPKAGAEQWTGHPGNGAGLEFWQLGLLGGPGTLLLVTLDTSLTLSTPCRKKDSDSRGCSRGKGDGTFFSFLLLIVFPEGPSSCREVMR